jgi:hypothetical protein
LILSVFKSKSGHKYKNKYDISDIRPYPIRFRPYQRVTFCRSGARVRSTAHRIHFTVPLPTSAAIGRKPEHRPTHADKHARAWQPSNGLHPAPTVPESWRVHMQARSLKATEQNLDLLPPACYASYSQLNQIDRNQSIYLFIYSLRLEKNAII